jgi:hypothetical protein
VLYGRLYIPLPLFRILDLIEDHTVMKLRYLCSSLLHDPPVRKTLSKLAHILQVAR